MKTSEFKHLIKESVREVIKEELKDILLEVMKTTKPIINENFIPKSPSSNNTPINAVEMKNRYMDIINDMKGNKTITSDSIFVPRPVDTTAEGSSLPPGELSLDQINNLFNK